MTDQTTDQWHSSRRQFLLGGVSLIGGALWLPGCGGGSSGNSIAPVQASSSRGVLSAGQIYPAVASSATGNVQIAVDAAQTQITVTLTTTGLSNVTGITINAGKAGATGPVIFTLLSQAAGTLPATFTKTLTATDLQVQASAGINAFSDAINAVLAGGAYLLVSTTANPTGEIRGQLGQFVAYATLTGSGSVAGIAQATVDPTFASATLTLQQTGLSSITGAEIQYFARPNQTTAGPVLFTLASADFGSSLAATLTASNFTPFLPQAGIGVATFTDFVNALLSGKIAIVVKTTTATSGALRGTFGFTSANSVLTANGQTVNTSNPSLGTLIATLAPTQDYLAVEVTLPSTTTTGITGITSITLNQGASGATGAVLATIFSSATNGTFGKAASALLDSTSLTNGVTFTNLIALLKSGTVYVNVTTTTSTTSAARGQLLVS